MNQVHDAPAAAAAPARTLFGQPRGLATLFLTEMWERFTYYGMRGVLILFMVAAVSHGGLGLDDKTASAIYGMYIGGTYLFGLLGSWIADRLLGAQRAVVAGGVLIAGGNLMLALGSTDVFFLGLLVITIGVGLLKPNASAMVAALYPEGGSRRDAGARRRLLRVSALLRGADRGRAPARAGDGGAGRGVGDFLGRLRADRRLDESLRRPLYRSARLRLGDAGRVAAGREPALHHRFRAGVRRPVDRARAARPGSECGRQVRRRPDPPR